MPSAGRPPFEPTEADRDTVRILLVNGFGLDAISREMQLSIPTIRFHFAEILEDAKVKAVLETERLLWASARNGNVSAQKALRQRLDIATVKQEKRATRRLGKKEEQVQDAIAASADDDLADHLPN